MEKGTYNRKELAEIFVQYNFQGHGFLMNVNGCLSFKTALATERVLAAETSWILTIVFVHSFIHCDFKTCPSRNSEHM